VRQLKASIAAETQARSLADSACTLLQQQAQDLAEATAQKEVRCYLKSISHIQPWCNILHVQELACGVMTRVLPHCTDSTDASGFANAPAVLLWRIRGCCC
jgi:hypothetical protein